MRLKTGSILSQDAIYCCYLLVCAVFNLIEVKNWLSLVIFDVGLVYFAHEIANSKQNYMFCWQNVSCV
jgi:hypothetical protein